MGNPFVKFFKKSAGPRIRDYTPSPEDEPESPRTVTPAVALQALQQAMVEHPGYATQWMEVLIDIGLEYGFSSKQAHNQANAVMRKFFNVRYTDQALVEKTGSTLNLQVSVIRDKKPVA